MRFFKQIENNQGIGDPLIVICDYELHNILLNALAKKDNLKGFEVYRNNLLVNDIIDKISKEKLNVPFVGLEPFIINAIDKYKEE